jgi:hypothetical protein
LISSNISAGGSSISSDTVSVNAPISRFQSAFLMILTSPSASHAVRNERRPS